jgi:DNA (cytosine-5)-methyltransferase 1
MVRVEREGLAAMILGAAEYRTGIEGIASLPPRRTFAEFFAGIGLMRLGLERRGWTLAFANDIDPQKAAMYRGHFASPDEPFVLGDVHALDPATIPSVTLATASFPCNDLSLAGARSGLDGKESSAFWGFIAVLAGLGARRPPLVLLENVTGFLSSRRGADFAAALTGLNRLGYSVDAVILDAARFVPQSRQRLFVIATLDGATMMREVPRPYRFFESEVRPRALADFILTHPEIRWRLRDLPPPPARGPRLETILDDLPPEAPEWWSAERAAYLLDQMSPRHRAIADRMIAGNEWTHGTVFRRVRHGRSMAELRTDGIAGCLRTPRGGSGRQILFRAGRGRYAARLITPREAARLMGADDYAITVPLNQALFGFGDAVCVPVVEWLAEHYLNPVAESVEGRDARNLLIR